MTSLFVRCFAYLCWWLFSRVGLLLEGDNMIIVLELALLASSLSGNLRGRRAKDLARRVLPRAVVELAEPLVAPAIIATNAKLLLLFFFFFLFHTKSSATMVLLPHATARLATAKNAAYVGKAITEAINAAKNNEVATSELLTQLSEEVASHTVYSYGSKQHYANDKFAPSPIYSKLIEAYK